MIEGPRARTPANKKVEGERERKQEHAKIFIHGKCKIDGGQVEHKVDRHACVMYANA